MKTLEFTIYDCTFIERDLYRWLLFMFPKYEEVKFGFKVNRQGVKIYFIRDDFLEELEQEGWI